jgi:hypothetical protein
LASPHDRPGWSWLLQALAGAGLVGAWPELARSSVNAMPEKNKNKQMNKKGNNYEEK